MAKPRTELLFALYPYRCTDRQRDVEPDRHQKCICSPLPPPRFLMIIPIDGPDHIYQESRCVFPLSSPPFDLSAPVTDCRATLYARTHQGEFFLSFSSSSRSLGDIKWVKAGFIHSAQLLNLKRGIIQLCGICNFLTCVIPWLDNANYRVCKSNARQSDDQAFLSIRLSRVISLPLELQTQRDRGKARG